MTVVDLYSKRQKRLNGDQLDVYIYDEIPQIFRIQVEYIVNNYFYLQRSSISTHNKIVRILREEYGLHQLADGCTYDPIHENYSSKKELFAFFENTSITDQCLDVIELFFKEISDDDYIAKLNIRFKENGLGYRFENDRILRIDNELLHSEVVKPALQFLSHANYKNVNEEFLNAFDDYKKGKYEDANHKCRKVFESMMKIICDKRDYQYNKDKDTVQKLLNVLKKNNFFPVFAEDHLNNLVGLLQGIGTIANKSGSHAEGTSDQALTSYLLHVTASVILFFSEIEKNRVQL